MAQSFLNEGISPQVVTELVHLLAQLVTPNSEAIAAAENQLNNQWLANQPGHLLCGLAHLVARHQDWNIRAYAAVLLRRILQKVPPTAQPESGSPADPANMITYWTFVTDDVRKYIQVEMLSALNTESVASVRRKIDDTISEICKSILIRNATWPELLEAVFQCTKFPSTEHRESAYSIIANVPNLIADQDVHAVKAVFVGAIQDPVQEVRLAALKAIVFFLLAANQQSRNAMADLVPQMLNLLPPILATQNEDAVVDAFTYFIDLAGTYPKLFRGVLPQLVAFVAEIMKNTDLETGTKHTALELLLTLAEGAPSTVRKHSQLHSVVIPIAMEWMADLEDEPSWYTTDDLDDEDGEADYIVGEQAMDRLARALGGKTVLPVAFSIIPRLLGSADWQHRHAGLMTISAIGEGCAAIMEAELDKVISLVIPFFRDPHPRVRHAVCNVIGQMSADFQPTMQKKFHEPILNHLIPVLDETDFPRLQAHAAAALVNFIEDVQQSALEPYLDVMFQKLLVLLGTGKTYVQEQALTTMATVADCAQDKFIKYYSAIMPILMNVLKQATQKEFRLLRGKAIECVSLIALSVGKEVFINDAKEVIEQLEITQRSAQDPDDPQTSFLLSAWARMCKVLGEDFAPYLDFVMAPLLASAQLKPDVALVDPDDEDMKDKYSPEEGWEFIGGEGRQKIGIKTSVLEEKCTAVEMLTCYVKTLGGKFYPYVGKVLEIAVPLLKFYFHDDILFLSRLHQCFVGSLNVKAGAAPEIVLPQFHAVAGKILESINIEPDPVFLSHLYAALHETMDLMGKGCLTEPLMEAFVTSVHSQLEEYFVRLKERIDARKDTDHDAEDEEALQDEQETDEFVLSELSRVVHSVFKSQGTSFLPFFEKLIPAIAPFMTNSDPAARQWAICVYDDLVEFTGPASWMYHTHFIEAFVAGLHDENVDVRQPAAYGIGVCAQFGGEHYAQVCTGTLNSLFAMINAPNSRDEENVMATENAISAIGKICHFFGAHFDVDSVLPAWVAALPIVNDDQEAPHTYSYLLELLQRNHSAVIGENRSNLPKLITIFTDALTSDILAEHEQLAAQLVQSLRAIMATCGDDVKQAVWVAMSPEKRQTLSQKGFI
ncbi:hypothetical protein HK102_000705 [Quaeritorhiza haematococci]|nr:hypothetical protein HK102_000705 [Quaeritorhiza haematococci]